VHRRQPFFLALFLVVVAALASAAAARAEVIVSRDAEGRRITFDVLAPNVDVEWYAGVLRNAVHGDEISTVTIRVVSRNAISGYCGARALACYGARRSGAVMYVPAGADPGVARTFLHEYGHHSDYARGGVTGSEPNGTPAWWTARGMQELLNRGLVAFDYSLGWSRSIAEVFAEDYAYIHLPGDYAIPWLAPPDERLAATLRSELAGGTPVVTPPAAPAVRPVVIDRRGTLVTRRTVTVPFGLLGPGRRVTLTTTVGRASRAGTRARVDIACDGRQLASTAFTRARPTRTIDLRQQGPGECRVRLMSTAGVRLAYTLRLRLAIENAP
jgi:hypothetical protein